MLKKNQTSITQDIEEKILSMYAKGMTTGDIETHIQDIYLAMMDITKKWTGRRQDWSLIHAQMAIYFTERMPE